METGSHKHILVVEDDPLVSEVVVDALDGLYDTSRAETAAAAMECLRAGGIDAMLLDCTLPGGLDPHLVPMADDLGVPVILMSGHPDMMDRVPGVCAAVHPEAVQPDGAAGDHRERRSRRGVRLTGVRTPPADGAALRPARAPGTALPGTPRWQAAAACR